MIQNTYQTDRWKAVFCCSLLLLPIESLSLSVCVHRLLLAVGCSPSSNRWFLNRPAKWEDLNRNGKRLNIRCFTRVSGVHREVAKAVDWRRTSALTGFENLGCVQICTCHNTIMTTINTINFFHISFLYDSYCSWATDIKKMSCHRVITVLNLSIYVSHCEQPGR